MSSVVISGDTSGSITLQAPAVSGSTTLTLPATTATLATLTTPSFASTIGVGGATASASGSGISFPATQSASSDANTLDDYEEGTWTPAFTPNGGGSATLSSAVGTYVKVGKTVTVYWSLYIASVTGASGTAGIGQLPFTTNDSGGTGANRAAIGISREDGSTGNAYQWYLNSNGTSGTVLSLTNGAVIWTVGYIYDGSLTYITSA